MDVSAAFTSADADLSQLFRRLQTVEKTKRLLSFHVKFNLKQHVSGRKLRVFTAAGGCGVRLHTLVMFHRPVQTLGDKLRDDE